MLHLATLAPVRPERLGRLYRRLAVVSHGPGLGRPLLDVMTIHCGRWIVFGNLPDRDGERQRPLNWSYLLFAAIYDGPRGAYLNTFADILPLRLAAVFGDCFGFEQRVQDAPGAGGRVLPAYAFRDYVTQCALPELASHHSVEATVRTIRQALAMQRVARRSDLLTGRALEQAQSTVTGMALAPPMTSPGLRDAVLTQAKHAIWRGHTLRPLTLVAPLKPDAPKPDDDTSIWPLTTLPNTTLFATVLTLPKTMQAQLGHPHPDRLPEDYLVFMADYYGKRSDYVDALRTNTEIHTILSRCVSSPSFRDRRGFRDWIRRHSLKTHYYFTGYAAPAIDDLQTLIAARAATAQWALGA